VAILGISTILLVTNIPLVGAQAADLTAPTVTGAMTVDGMDNEAFWAEATSQTFSLTATPGTDVVPANQRSVTMKAAITDTKIRVYFEWVDPTESNTASGHEDRLALMILMEGANDMDAPCMNTTTNGATTSGTADQWHWKASRTDSGGAKHIVVNRRGVAYNTGGTATTYNSLPVAANSAIYYEENSTSSGWDLSDMGGSVGDQVYYVAAATGSWRWSTSANGSAIPLVVDLHDFSFAENEFLDTESRKRSGDSEYTGFGVLPSALSGEERYFVNAKGDHDGSGWSLEIERDLAVTNAVVDKAFAAGDTIKFAIAVYDGAYDHDHEMKYITSAWKTILLQGPVSATPAIPGYSVVLLGLVAFGTIGIIYISIKRRK
jgi:hypothetical protein